MSQLLEEFKALMSREHARKLQQGRGWAWQRSRAKAQEEHPELAESDPTVSEKPNPPPLSARRCNLC